MIPLVYIESPDFGTVPCTRLEDGRLAPTEEFRAEAAELGITVPATIEGDVTL